LIKTWLESRWFALADLICAALAGIAWYARPGLGAWPLILALAPWAVRIAAGRFPFRRTSQVPFRGWFDLPLALFLTTAAAGVWAAYDPARAWAKFWVLVSAVALYYALANQPRANLWLAAGAASLCGVYISAYFLLAHNWEALPADIGLLNRLGLWWMSIRPELSLRPLYDNVAGGLLAMLLPFSLAAGLRAWTERRIRLGVFALGAGALTGAGLLMTSSRAAWLALAAALGAWFLWGASGLAARWVRRPRGVIFVVAVLLVCSPAVVYLFNYPGGLTALANRLPGPNGTSRLDLARETVRLAGDFLFTGGGLSAFSGLYSRYVRIIPVSLFNYSHNFLLDVALEQGLFGLLALAAILLGSAGALIRRIGFEPDASSGAGFLRWATLAGLIVVGAHGLLGDALYSEGGTPLLFLFAGMTAAMTAPESAPVGESASPAPALNRRSRAVVVMGIVMACAAVLIGFYRPLRSGWYANLGAVWMAQIELGEWRDGEVNDLGEADLSSAEALFNQSLTLDPGNRTAHHRLGLIALRDRDFRLAVTHLEAAYQLDQGNRGVNKALGYAYIWQGQFDRALLLLAAIPEAQDELNTYAWWWGTQGRDDLSERAAQMAARLDAMP
jgi:tetratricopeptide (TPR) repeat protein